MGNPEGDLLTALLPIAVLFLIFYFLIIRPQQQQQKKHKTMISDLKKGDDIITTGGLHAKVVKVEDKFLSVSLTDKVIVKLEKEFISKVVVIEDKSS